MRADRLVAALLLLQIQGRMTAASLADELEVSVATARRDLEALASAGIPVYPQAGRGGGWQLVGGARTDLTGLTADEAQALFLLLGPAVGSSPQAEAALRKLVQALPATFRADARAAADAVIVDQAGWGADAGPRTPSLVHGLQVAVVGRTTVRMRYRSRAGAVTARVVEPWGLADKVGVWYLLAGTDRGRRTFRVDRIIDVEATGDRFTRPSDLTLAEAWREVVAEVEQQRARVHATVALRPEQARSIEQQFGRHCRRTGELDDGRVRVELGGPTARMLAEHLAGWGDLLEVLDPPAVRAELARIGGALVDRYG